jgi:GNAT superfamily N-acetyltransferase
MASSRYLGGASRAHKDGILVTMCAMSAKEMLEVKVRPAVAEDIPVLRELIEASVRGLQAQDYTPTQLEGALKSVYGVDSQLIADGTYYVAEMRASERQGGGSSGGGGKWIIAGCGGWSKRKTLYGGDRWIGRTDDLLDPRKDAAKIRAFFIHPDWARKGIGSVILTTCENAAREAGFTRCEMGATLTGVPMYRARGYAELENLEVPLGNGEALAIVRMGKSI